MYLPGVRVSTLDPNPAAIGALAAMGGGREFDCCVLTYAKVRWARIVDCGSAANAVSNSGNAHRAAW
jgi:hypothetical protein